MYPPSVVFQSPEIPSHCFVFLTRVLFTGGVEGVRGMRFLSIFAIFVRFLCSFMRFQWQPAVCVFFPGGGEGVVPLAKIGCGFSFRSSGCQYCSVLQFFSSFLRFLLKFRVVLRFLEPLTPPITHPVTTMKILHIPCAGRVPYPEIIANIQI